MKILFLSINASWSHSCLALYYLRNAVRDLDYQTDMLELTLKQQIPETMEAIHKLMPDVLCLPVYIWNVEYFKQLVPEIRKLMPRLIIVVGGPEVTYNGKATLAFAPNYLVKGYGVAGFRKLAENNFNLPDKVIAESRIPLADITFPYTDGDKALIKGKMLYYEASRGCAYKCSYCLSSRQEELEWLPVERVCSDINKLLEFKPKVIKFVDRSFNLKKDWARLIWQYVIELDTSVPFHFEVHPDLLEDDDIRILSNAPRGRIQLEIGIQTVHPVILRLIDRVSDWDKARTALIELKARTSLPVHADLIVGLPGEDINDIRGSVNEVLLTYPHELQLGFLKILSGTPMVEYATKHAYLWSDFAPYTVYQTPDLPFTEFQHLERLASIISNYYNKGDFVTVWAAAFNWRQPYDCLEELLEISHAEDEQLHSIDRIKRFAIIAEWIEQKWSEEQKTYLKDALKWDWCRKAGESWYPPSLDGESAVQFRKEHYTEIVDWLKAEFWENENWNLKRFIVFSVSSFEFSQDYLDGATYAVFVSVKNSQNAILVYNKLF